MNKISRKICEKTLRISAPFIKKDKEDIIQVGSELGVNFNLTRSCYADKKDHCGVCLACALRKQGFYWAGVPDPTRYLE